MKNTNYEKFTKEMETKMQGLLDTYHKEDGLTARLFKTVKNNGKKRVGIYFIKKDMNISLIIYLEGFYEKYINGETMTSLVQRLYDLYQKEKLNQPFVVADLYDYSSIKGKVVSKLINKERNQEFLKDVPYTEVCDLAEVYMVLFEEYDNSTATMLIRSNHLDQWNITKDDLVSDAKKNLPELLPAELRDIRDVVFPISGKFNTNLALNFPPIFVLSNKIKKNGATAILYPGVLDEVKAILKDDFYILPSSIHECILIPMKAVRDVQHLFSMVKEVNETEIADEEILSNNVYVYSNDGLDIV